MKRVRIWPFIFLPLLLLSSVLIGAALGKGLAVTKNTINTENFTEFETSAPTKLLDINGELITEYSSDEKREIIAFRDLPQQMVDALLTREDRIFYEHPGFSMKAIFRAVVGVVTHSTAGGGSTLTQQIAGTLYCDRREKSIKRKIKELWWAIQMERRYSKDEILELYLNKIYFGGGTYGVNAACKYYFGHDATEINPAEAAILVIQLSNPAYYNPFEYPNRAMARQQDVLDAMVNEGYVTKEDANTSFDNYWADFDFLRTNLSVHTMRVDNAPWFSEYVRRELSGMLYGSEDLYNGGYTVNTTLNLTHQRAAEEIMTDYIKYANETYRDTLPASKKEALSAYVPFAELMCLAFNLPSMKVSAQRAERLSLEEYADDVNPIIDIMSMITGIEPLKTQIVTEGNNLYKRNTERNTVEGTMIALENGTGYIDALVGGSKYDSTNQFIRAVQAKIQPGSTFKPLYYSAAIDSKLFTMTTTISDTPVVFYKDDGSPYLPRDFVGRYEGEVQTWYALAHSMNIPSLKVLDTIGFDAAINRATDLLNIPYNEWEARSILPVYPLGLGVCSIRPIELARAFCVFASNGEEITPIAIRNVEDKNGNIFMDPEADAIAEKKAKGRDIQVISRQNAYIMQEMLKRTVQTGTLVRGSNFSATKSTIGKDKGTGNKFKFTDSHGESFIMPAGGKTGTTQNWADAWTVGFTPYYTAAFWFGFDRPGQSLGLKMTGSTLAGVAWGDFMHVANLGKPYKKFTEVAPEGVISLTVCSETGLLLTPECGNNKVTAFYLAGTEPTEVCERHLYGTAEKTAKANMKREDIMFGKLFDKLEGVEGLKLDLDFLNDDGSGTAFENMFDDDDDFNYDPDSYLESQLGFGDDFFNNSGNRDDDFGLFDEDEFFDDTPLVNPLGNAEPSVPDESEPEEEPAAPTKPAETPAPAPAPAQPAPSTQGDVINPSEKTDDVEGKSTDARG